METVAPIELRKPQAVEIAEHTTPDQLLTLAINKDLDIEKLAKLMELQRDYNADLAKKAFFSAMGTFQAIAPEIRKNKTVAFKDVKYTYAPLSDIVRQIKEACKACGLSYRWEIQDNKEELKVTCLITHIDGHTEKTTMTAGPDGTGSKNPIQARGSSIEYLKRYTLIGALGLSTTDSDVDGQMPEIDMDILHKQYIVHYNQLIQIDAKYTKWHPDEWKSTKTSKLYIQAIGDIRRKLAELTPKKA